MSSRDRIPQQTKGKPASAPPTASLPEDPVAELARVRSELADVQLRLRSAEPDALLWRNQQKNLLMRERELSDKLREAEAAHHSWQRRDKALSDRLAGLDARADAELAERRQQRLDALEQDIARRLGEAEQALATARSERAEAEIARDQALARVDAELAERRAALEADISERRAVIEAALCSRRAELEDALAARRTSAEDELDAQLSLARAEAAGLKKEARALLDQGRAAVARAEEDAAQAAQGSLETARQEREARLAAAETEAEARMEAARAQVAALHARTAEEIAALRLQAAGDAARERTGAATDAARVRGEADRLLRESEATADSARKAAEAEAAAILRAAEAEAEATRHLAREEALRHQQAVEASVAADRDTRLALVTEREVAVRHREEEAMARAAALDEHERDLAHREADTARRDRVIAAREADLEVDLTDLGQRREALDDRVDRISSAAVERLELQVRELTDRLEEARARHRDVATERDALSGRLAELGGDGLSARLDELERLRTKVAEQRLALSQAMDEDHVAELHRRIAHLEPYKAQVQDATKRADDLERAQAGADQRVREVRLEQERVAMERDGLDVRVKLLEADLQAARAFQAERDRVVGEIEALRTERDWLAAERERLVFLLDVRKRASDARLRRHYGKLADLDDAEALPALFQRYRVPEFAGEPPPLHQLAQAAQARMARHKEDEHDGGRRYHLDDVRAFLGGLAAGRILVLKGLSGTGKSSLPLYMARALGAVCELLPVQSGWRDRMDLLGTWNAFTEELRPTEFTELLYTASLPAFRDRPFFIVLDECNLSRVEYYFADFLSELQKPKDVHTVRLLERAPGQGRPAEAADGGVGERPPEKPWPDELEDGRLLKIPKNVWFVLTANEDESTFELADKTFDRASILQMDERAPQRLDTKDLPLAPVSFSGLDELLRQATPAKVPGAHGEWLTRVEEKLRKELELSLGNRFPEQAAAFYGVFTGAGGEPEDALDRLVATKVLRKVARERDPGRRDAIDAVRRVVKDWPFKGTTPERSLKVLDRVYDRLS